MSSFDNDNGLTPHKLFAAKMSAAQVTASLTHLEQFACELASNIGYEIATKVLLAKVDSVYPHEPIKLPWWEAIEFDQPYAIKKGAYDYKAKFVFADHATVDNYVALICKIEGGWLDRVDAYIAAKSQAARNRIAKERPPYEIEHRDGETIEEYTFAITGKRPEEDDEY